MKKYILFLLMLLVSVMLISCAPSVQTYKVTLYNSNDGSCTMFGESLDFYVDDEKVATIAAGENEIIKLTEGQYTFNAKIEGTTQYLFDGFTMNITEDSLYWAGCTDGTHPDS